MQRNTEKNVFGNNEIDFALAKDTKPSMLAMLFLSIWDKLQTDVWYESYVRSLDCKETVT